MGIAVKPAEERTQHPPDAGFLARQIDPTGKSVIATKTCPALSAKIFRFRRRANQFYQLAPSHPRKRGVSRSSRTRDGMRWTRQRWRAELFAGRFLVSEHSAQDERRWLRTAKPCGPDTRCWCQAAGGDLIQPDRSAIKPAVTVTRRIRRRGEHGISRKAIAQGMPDCLR